MAERDIVNVAEVADRHQPDVEMATAPSAGDKDQVTLSTGVVLKITSVSPMAFGDLENKYPSPPIPRVYDEVKGREISNPLSAEYKKAVAENENRKALAALDLAIVLGTRLLSIPKGMDGPDSEEWKDTLFAMGYNKESIESKKARYLSWVKLNAASNNADWNMLSMTVMRRMGVPEQDVNAALKSFPDQS